MSDFTIGLRNDNGGQLKIADLGLVIAVGETVPDLFVEVTPEEFYASTDLETKVSAGEIVMIEGGQDLSIADALTLLKSPHKKYVDDQDTDLQNELDKVEVAIGTDANGDFVAPSGSNYTDTSTSVMDAVSKLDTQAKVNADAIAGLGSGPQAELDATQEGAGLGADGTYSPDESSNYIKAADFTAAGKTADLASADELLDAEIKRVSDEVVIIAAATINANDIGVPGEAGFGVGVCPESSLPPGYSPLPGYSEVGHDNYGNYVHYTGSIACWIPKHYVKWGTGSNGVAVNELDIKPATTYESRAHAAQNGYALPRGFIDGGVEHQGVMVWKYEASKISWGSGYICASIKNGLPISTNASHNPIADLTACGANTVGEIFSATRAINGINGAEASTPTHFPCSRFVYTILAALSLSHGLASSGTANCAWYDATGVTNYPKGCNYLCGDIDEGTVTYVSDGWSSCGKTGSGTPFAKTTHNGQVCGVADLNGPMAEFSPGLSTWSNTEAIIAMTRANPCKITEVSHGAQTGDLVILYAIAQSGGWTAINNKMYTITVIDSDNFTLDGVDTSGFTEAYSTSDPGTMRLGIYFVAKESTKMSEFTGGETEVTDHWGSATDKFEEFGIPPFQTDYPDNGFDWKMGNGSNQVFSEATEGDGYIMTALGMPDTDGCSLAGTNKFGCDQMYQYIRINGGAMSGSAYNAGVKSGIWSLSWMAYRDRSVTSVGFRAAAYPE